MGASLVLSAFAALVGAVAGSFLATLALRWGQGRSVVRGRSACDGCGRPLAGWELVPLASGAALAWRCRTCRAPIDPRHAGLEIACAGIGAAALATHPGADGWAGALFGWLLAVLALLDRDHFWLPDRLVIPLGLAGFAAGLAGLDPAPGERAAGAAIGFALLSLVRWGYRRTRGREGLGGGDPKLFAAIGAWLGWRPLPAVLIGAAGLGLFWCLWRAARGRTLRLTDALPLGTLLALAAWPLWLVGDPLS